MPTFSALKTTVQLSVADLARTAILIPRTQQSLASSEAIRNASQDFARGSKDGTLAETTLYTDDGSHLWFLGKQGHMPFYMVHAGKSFFDPTTKERRNRRPARVPFAGVSGGESTSIAVGINGEAIGIGTSKDASIEPEPNREYRPPLMPHALCLTVFLSPSSFKNTVAGRVEINDVKIDVYFNGALCDSRYVPRRYSDEAYTMTEHIVRFGGRRIDYLLEKPWVIVPPGQNPDGSLREHRRGKGVYAGTQQRWNDISNALLAEADKFGRDEKGERPVIGEYLESLAEFSMPKEVEDMQKAGGPKFGVVDVVVMWGKGSKDGPGVPYIWQPTPMRIKRPTSVNMVPSVNRSSVQDVTRSGPRSAYTAPQSRSEAPATAKAIDDYSNNTPLPSIPPSPTPTATNNKTAPAAFFPQRPEKAFIPAAPPLETPIRRPGSHYYDVFTTKKTLSEEMDSIATTTAATILNPAAAGLQNTQIPAGTRARRARASCFASSLSSTAANHQINNSSSLLNKNSSGPAMTSDHISPRTENVTLKLPPPLSSSSPNKPSSSPYSSSPPTTTTTTNPTTHPPPVNTMAATTTNNARQVRAEGKVMDNPPREPLPPPFIFDEEGQRQSPLKSPAFLKRRGDRATYDGGSGGGGGGDDGKLGESVGLGFTVPGLSEDCCVTYAGQGWARNLEAVRGGEFEEGGVGMGVRFLVGWG